jgi:hypothetical protein
LASKEIPKLCKPSPREAKNTNNVHPSHTIQISKSTAKCKGCLSNETDLLYQDFIVKIVLLHLRDHFGLELLVELHLGLKTRLIPSKSSSLFSASIAISVMMLCEVVWVSQTGSDATTCSWTYSRFSDGVGLLSKFGRPEVSVSRPWTSLEAAVCSLALSTYQARQTLHTNFFFDLETAVEGTMKIQAFYLLILVILLISFISASNSQKRKKNYYEILEVEKDSSTKEIKKSYFKLAMKVRPFEMFPPAQSRLLTKQSQITATVPPRQEPRCP